jgi:hypothetical protein
MRLAIVCIVCAGCDLVFPLHTRDAAALDDSSDAPRDAPIDVAACAPSYSPRSSLPNVYRRGAVALDWTMSEQDCESDGGHLAAPASPQDFDRIRAIVAVDATIWLGIGRDADSSFGDFRTLTGAAIPLGTSFWNNAEPNGVSDLVAELSTVDLRLLNDTAQTGISNRFVCECDHLAITSFSF